MIWVPFPVFFSQFPCNPSCWICRRKPAAHISLFFSPCHDPVNQVGVFTLATTNTAQKRRLRGLTQTTLLPESPCPRKIFKSKPAISLVTQSIPRISRISRLSRLTWVSYFMACFLFSIWPEAFESPPNSTARIAKSEDDLWQPKVTEL